MSSVESAIRSRILEHGGKLLATGTSTLMIFGA